MMGRFKEAVNNILVANGWHPVAEPELLVQTWESFVKECEGGYKWTIYEYDNEIRVRERIELLITHPRLDKYEELQEFILKVKAIDSRMKDLFVPSYSRKNKQYWWEKGILKYAGEEYARDLNQEYDIEIKVV